MAYILICSSVLIAYSNTKKTQQFKELIIQNVLCHSLTCFSDRHTMAPPSKGKTAALGISSSSFVDHMRAFNVAVAEYKLAHAQQSTSRALADLEKILPVLTRISDPAGHRVPTLSTPVLWSRSNLDRLRFMWPTPVPDKKLNPLVTQQQPEPVNFDRLLLLNTA